MSIQCSNLVAKYFYFSAAYGVLRKTFQVYDGYTEDSTWDDKTRKIVKEKIPLLVTDKMMVVATTAFISPGMFPIYFLSDLRQLEIKARGLDKERHSSSRTRYHAIDYLFE